MPNNLYLLREFDMNGKTICVDFDGVVHKYTGDYSPGVFNEPKNGAMEALVKLNEAGYSVVILTARADLASVKAYIIEHLGDKVFPIRVTDKKPPAIAYIDDRAIRFTTWADAFVQLGLQWEGE